MADRPSDDQLWNSLAAVAEAYGAPVTATGNLAAVFQNLDLKSVPPELAIAVAEALGYVYGLDHQAETQRGKKR